MPNLHLFKNCRIVANGIKNGPIEERANISFNSRSIGQPQLQPVTADRLGLFDSQHSDTAHGQHETLPLFYGGGATG